MSTSIAAIPSAAMMAASGDDDDDDSSEEEQPSSSTSSTRYVWISSGRRRRVAARTSDAKHARTSDVGQKRRIRRSQRSWSAMSSSQRHAAGFWSRPVSSSELSAGTLDFSFACASVSARKRQPSCSTM